MESKMTQMNIENLIKKNMGQIKEIMEELDIDDIEAVLERVRVNYNSLPVSRFVPPERNFERALTFTAGDFSSGDAYEKLEIVVLGYNKPKDWNEQETNNILSDWEKGPVKQQELKDAGKVMTMKTPTGREAVSEIESTVYTDEGELQVIKGTIIVGDAKPIPRDYNKETSYADGTSHPNKHYSKPLGTRWNINFYGITNDGVKNILVKGSTYDNYDGLWANPKSEDFLPRKAPAFGFYDANVMIDKEKSTDTLIIVKSIGGITPKEVMIEDEVKEDGVMKKINRPLLIQEYIYGVMAGVEIDGEIYSPLVDFREYINGDESVRKTLLAADIEFVVDFKYLKEFHELVSKKDKDGNVVIGTTGKSYSVWSAHAISFAVCKKAKEVSNGNTMITFVTGKGVVNCFLDPAIIPIPEITKSSECLVSFNTMKLSTRWDSKTKKAIEDPANGDLQLNNILGIKKTFELID